MEYTERELAAHIAIQMYADEPCRICGQLLTSADLKDAIFAGYSDDKTSRAVHGVCWRNMIDVVRKAHKAGLLDLVLQGIE